MIPPKCGRGRLTGFTTSAKILQRRAPRARGLPHRQRCETLAPTAEPGRVRLPIRHEGEDPCQTT
ncbi:hypothetical protein roselon_03379 [Roseibacterium elongatum DSM 19469]|uniref:Uncharacterized protein n=1 Tax=Roseicyclus elongatus DSM 19469 TaxID=1294273 RepID=W8S5X5_9RHOB|nr:hypothetical protein roselon_03379 [Roseibacterium elongatum DSM 19469]